MAALNSRKYRSKNSRCNDCNILKFGKISRKDENVKKMDIENLIIVAIMPFFEGVDHCCCNKLD